MIKSPGTRRPQAVKTRVRFLDVIAVLALVLVVRARQSTGDIRKDKGLINKANSAVSGRSLGQRALGLFAAVWLNLALQPCAMAMEGDHDCPHCPPAREHEMAGHHGHAVQAEKARCASLDSACGELDDASLDGRTGHIKLKQLGEVPVAITPRLAEFGAVPATTIRSSTGPPRCPGRFPPLHVLYCVYLK
jgi:hypothetical protein